MSRVKITTSEWILKAKNIHGNKYDYSKVNYTRSSQKVKIICYKHGEFELTPNNHLRGQGCPKCKYELHSLQTRQTKEDFINKASKIHSNKYDYSKSEYINNRAKICIVCPKHGEFWLVPHDHISGCGCPKCRLVGQTKLYNRLKKEFPDLEILFEAGCKQIPWIGLLRIDIYIPKLNIAIEYNGRLHYMPVNQFGGTLEYKKALIRDEIKRLKCLEHGCVLFEIKYNYTKNDFSQLINNINKLYYENNT